MKLQKKIEAEFYRSLNGNEPVRDALLKLGRPTKTDIGEDIGFIEINWRVDRPYVDRLTSKSGLDEVIYEVRTRSQGKEYRILFFVYENRMILLSLFQKTSQKTPKLEIELAKTRMRIWLQKENGKRV